MRWAFSTFILLLFIVGCGPDAGPLMAREYSYNEESGKCENLLGQTGFNDIDLEAIRLSKDCECMKFSKVEVLDLAGDTIAIPQRLGYYDIKGYNFRGAVLDSCYLYFNLISAADLRGADLSTLQYGYAFVTGRKDHFTKAPLEGTVTIDGDSLRCFR